MAAATLVEFPLEAGRRLIEKLAENHVPVTVAFWQFQQEEEAWQMVLSSPDVLTKGSRYMLNEIQSALDLLGTAERDGLSLRHIIVLNPRLMRVEDVRARYGVVEHEQEHDDRWKIYSRSEPYIYRLLPA